MVKRGKGVREGTGPEGERGGKNKGKRVGGKGPKAHSENSDYGAPMIWVLFGGLSKLRAHRVRGILDVLEVVPLQPKLQKENSVQNKCSGAENGKESALYLKQNSLAFFLAKRDTPVAVTLQENPLVELVL